MLGSRSIYHQGWKATTDHVGRQLTVERERLQGSLDFDTDRWALFDLGADFAEATDVAAEHPDRVRQLVELWWAEAGRNQVLPLDDSFIGRASALEPPPSPPRFRTVLRPGGGPVSEDTLFLAGGFRAIAEVDVPSEGVEGVLCALGDWSNGWALYVLDGRLVAAFNLFGAVARVAAPEPVPAGRHRLGVDVRSGGRGCELSVTIDGAAVAEGRLGRSLPFRWQIGGGGLLVGRDAGFPVCDDYRPPFPFTGTLHEVTIELPGLAPRDAATEVALALHRE